MLLLDRTGDAATSELDRTGDNAQALFKEARRRRRRRWTAKLLMAATVALATTSLVLHASIDTRGRPGEGGAFGELPVGTAVPLRVAGALAVAPDGALYVADVAGDRVLVRLPDGRFRVVAGNGTVGFSGDGRAAVRACPSLRTRDR